MKVRLVIPENYMATRRLRLILVPNFWVGLLFLAAFSTACTPSTPLPPPSLPETTLPANSQVTLGSQVTLPPVYAASAPTPYLTSPTNSSPTPPPATLADPAAVQSTPDPSQMGRDSWLELSPDGAWQAEIEVAFPALTGEETPSAGLVEPRFYSRLVFRHASGSPAWTVVDEWRPFGLGAATPRVFFWSPTGDFVLIADSATPDGCSPFPYLSRLRRVDLRTGAVQSWAENLQGVLAITPAGDTLIVFENPAPTLRLVDVNSTSLHITRAERQVAYVTVPDPGEWQAGGARWDPAGRLLAFTAYPAGCPPEETYIFTLDPLSGQVESILDGAPGWLDITDWTGLGLVLGDRGGSRWLLDPNADTLTPLP